MIALTFTGLFCAIAVLSGVILVMAGRPAVIAG